MCEHVWFLMITNIFETGESSIDNTDTTAHLWSPNWCWDSPFKWGKSCTSCCWSHWRSLCVHGTFDEELFTVSWIYGKQFVFLFLIWFMLMIVHIVALYKGFWNDRVTHWVWQISVGLVIVRHVGTWSKFISLHAK